MGVAIASIPKARCQMDGLTLEINRCCADPRYADVCSNLYARTIRIGREMGYTRFLTYTLPEESGRIPGGRGRSQPIRRLERPLAPAQYQTVSLRR